MKRFLGVFFVIMILVGCQQRTVFDDERALEHYQILRAYRNSFPGFEGNDVIRQYIFNQLRISSGIIEETGFETNEEEVITDPERSIIYRFYPQMSRRILFVTPYTLPVAEERDDRIETAERISFNLAIMLQLAEMLTGRIPRQYGVDLVFLDYLADGEDLDEIHPTFRSLNECEEKIKPEFGLFLWLTGERELRIPIDHQSYQELPHIVDQVWGRAQESGWNQFGQDIVVNRAFEGEDILHEKFNTIRMQNAGADDVAEGYESIKGNYRTIGALLGELIYAGD